MSKVQSSDQLCFDLNFDRGEKFFKRINFLFESTKVVSFRSWLLIRIYLHRIVRFTKVFYSSVHVWCIIILFSDIFFLAYTFYFEVSFFSFPCILFERGNMSYFSTPFVTFLLIFVFSAVRSIFFFPFLFNICIFVVIFFRIFYIFL